MPIYRGLNGDVMAKNDRVLWPSLSSTISPVIESHETSDFPVKQKESLPSNALYKYDTTASEELKVETPTKIADNIPEEHQPLRAEEISFDLAEDTLNLHDLKDLSKLMGTNSLDETVNYLKQLANDPHAISQIKSFLETSRGDRISHTRIEGATDDQELYNMDLEVIDDPDIPEQEEKNVPKPAEETRGQHFRIRYPMPLWNSRSSEEEIQSIHRTHLNTPRFHPVDRMHKNGINRFVPSRLNHNRNNQRHHHNYHSMSKMDNSIRRHDYPDFDGFKHISPIISETLH